MSVPLAAALWIGVAGLLGGCSSQPTARQDGGANTAQCAVCAQRGDLGCLNVKVDQSTPTSEYQGKTYYFCSAECKTAFDKNPAKYR